MQNPTDKELDEMNAAFALMDIERLANGNPDDFTKRELLKIAETINNRFGDGTNTRN